MLEKRPQDRYASMQDVADAITAAIQPSPTQAVEAAHAIEPQASPSGSDSRGKRVMLAMALAAAAILLATIIIRLRTTDGTLVVELDRADAEVRVVSETGAVEIIRQSDGGVLRLSVVPGTHRLMIEKDGFRAYSTKFEIAGAKPTVIRANLEPVPAAPVAAAKPESQRDIALWLVRSGARVQAADSSVAGSPLKWYADPTSLSSGQLQIQSLAWEVKNALPHFTSDDARRLAHCTDVESISLRDQRLMSTEWLTVFPQLKSLTISGGSSSDAAIQAIGRLNQLRQLSIRAYPSGISPSGWRFLRDLQTLEELWF